VRPARTGEVGAAGIGVGARVVTRETCPHALQRACLPASDSPTLMGALHLGHDRRSGIVVNSGANCERRGAAVMLNWSRPKRNIFPCGATTGPARPAGPRSALDDAPLDGLGGASGRERVSARANRSAERASRTELRFLCKKRNIPARPDCGPYWQRSRRRADGTTGRARRGGPGPGDRTTATGCGRGRASAEQPNAEAPGGSGRRSAEVFSRLKSHYEVAAGRIGWPPPTPLGGQIGNQEPILRRTSSPYRFLTTFLVHLSPTEGVVTPPG